VIALSIAPTIGGGAANIAEESGFVYMGADAQ
jgi:hypothetical protein